MIFSNLPSCTCGLCPEWFGSAFVCFLGTDATSLVCPLGLILPPHPIKPPGSLIQNPHGSVSEEGSPGKTLMWSRQRHSEGRGPCCSST